MTLSRYISIILILLAAVSCNKENSALHEDDDCNWGFVMTKSGEAINTKATFRTSLLNTSTGALTSDGSYSGYYNHKNWLTPCRTDDDGNALDSKGNKIQWDDKQWYEKTDKATKYGLRGPNGGHTLIITSPAIRMKKYKLSGQSTIKWGYPIDRKTSKWAISAPIENLTLSGAYLYNGSVTREFNAGNIPILEHRAMVTVKVACGSISSAKIHSVYFQNIISSANYNPKSQTYDNVVIDGGKENPLDVYYTQNSYPTGENTHTGEGEKLIVPDGKTINLTRIENLPADISQAWSMVDGATEWDSSTNTGEVLTAIRDFPILPLDYSVRNGETYLWEDIMPQIIVRSGESGDIKATITLAANIEPMKKYNIYVYISNAFVSVNLTVADWNTHRHWTDDPDQDKDELEVVFGTYAKIDGSNITIGKWREVENSETITD